MTQTTAHGTSFFTKINLISFIATVLLSNLAHAQMDHSPKPQAMMGHEMMEHRNKWGPSSCKDDEAWDNSQGMCLGLNLNSSEKMQFMVHGNAFLTGIWAEKPRGKDQFAVPNMIMANLGRPVGESQYLNVNLMLTFERWTFHEDGYSELLQIGERDSSDKPFIDAQHPHSSPIMGLTLSDTFYLGQGKDNLKLFFAPRGQSTDGPIAFMHRPTGMANPDAPLGHHLAQDVGHITSTVLGASVTKNKTTIEISTFHGEEPEPTKTDLPMGDFNSYAARLSQELSENWFIMTSAAFIKEPEGDHNPNIDHIWRYSLTSYTQVALAKEWTWTNSLIYGVINFYDDIPKLVSLNEEFILYKKPYNVWGRFEFVQRTAAQLEILTASDIFARQDVYALTLGYTHDLAAWEQIKFGLGGSLTKVLLPAELESAYNSDPVSGRIFIQILGMWFVADQ